MKDFSSTSKDHINEDDKPINNNNLNDGSAIPDTSPVYIFCTSKNGINSKNENGWTPIYRSIITNNLIALNELLKLGSDPNIANNLGETPLYLCVDIDNYDALIILLQYNADTNISKRNGTTPLHLAAKKNKYNFMHALLRNKANPNLPNKLYSQTPTHIAIINKVNEEMLNIFHEYNADIYKIKDKYNKTPFDYCKELKDEEYLQIIIKIFGDKNENNKKESKTLVMNKISDEIQKETDKTFNIPKSFHNSNYNILPEKLLINQNEEYYNKKLDFNMENQNEENIDLNNNNNKIIESVNKKTEKVGILSSGDNLYSDRTISKISETSKTKKDITYTNNIINNLNNNNNLSEFQPIPITTEHNDIKHKNSLIKTLKTNINIDTKMIDNSKDIIVLNNDNHDLNNNNNNINSEKKDINDKNYIIKSENNKLYFKDIENKLIGIYESNEESKNKNDTINHDKEIIKNIISSTVKKIKVYSNTFNSDSSQNNGSITQKNNNSNSKNEVLKLMNFTSNSNNINKDNNEQKLSFNTNLENGTSSFILYNSKKSDSENEHKNENLTQNQISEITPISIKKIDTQITHTDNSNLFSELELNKINDINKIEEENIKEENNKEENINNKINNNLKDDNQEDKDNLKNHNQLTNNSCDNYIYDGSFEYSKSKSYLPELSLNNNQNQSNKKIGNSNNVNNNLLNQYHRQISYHNNKSINKRKKDEEIQNEELNNISGNKENETQNNNEIIYYNKNYLANNISTKKEENFIEPKNEVIQQNIPKKLHTQSDINNNMNIQRYNSITNKTDTINQKRFTYTSPNIKKNYLIITNLIKNNDKENLDINNNNTFIKTNLNINTSNLVGTKEDFLSNNNNLSSFLNTNKLETVKDKQSNSLKTNNNKDNSTFNLYDDVPQIKHLEKKDELNEETINSNTNKDNNKNTNTFKNENKLRNNIRRSSMGNTTLSSLTKNLINPGKQSIFSTSNNILNTSHIIFTARNSNLNNISNNAIKNIPMNMLLRLRDWLISCDLLCYYNVLIENNMYDIDKCINGLQNNKFTISYKDVEDLGIRKPGHIFRLLLKLEIDSGVIDNNIFNYILSKFNMSSSISNNIILTSSIADINCCGICSKNDNYQSYIKRSDFPYIDIFSFLKYKDLWKYKENFLHNGFDQLEYVLLQLFSRYAYDKEIMNDCLHIYNDQDKLNVLNKLYEEKKNISVECGLESDNQEINKILSNNSYSSKYNSKKKSHYSFENSPKDHNGNNCCYIF